MNDDRVTIWQLGLEAIRRLFADEAIPLAGNIAFRTLFSLFPFLIFLTALAGFLGTEDLVQLVVNYLLSVAPEQLVRPLAPEIPASSNTATTSQPWRLATVSSSRRWF